MYKRIASYILSRKYKNEIHREIHHLINAYAIDNVFDASRMMRPQQQDDTYRSPLQNRSKNQGGFRTQHPKFKVDILHHMLTTRQKQR
jgi:hypothetical protein